MIGNQCRVCGRDRIVPFARIEEKTYWRCEHCRATLLDPEHFPDMETELTQYRLHDNRIDDPRYRQFLARLADPLCERLEPHARGLDFGCGPGPALAAMLEERGHPMAVYDPFFAPDGAVLDQVYDFVCCTETAEHFHDPAAEFSKLMAVVRPGGWLAIMTCFQLDDSAFAQWQYRKDPTHVVFYREETLACIADDAGWKIEVPRKDVALMLRPD